MIYLGNNALEISSDFNLTKEAGSEYIFSITKLSQEL